MKKLILLLSALCVLTSIVGQEATPNKKNLVPFVLQQDSVKGYQIFVDANNELQFIVILDSIAMVQDEIYNKLVSLFTPSVEEPLSNLDVKDRAAGQIVGKKYLKDFSKTSYEFMNASVKTINDYTFSAYLNYRIDIKSNRVRIKLSVQRVAAKVVQMPMTAAKLDYSKLIGRMAPLEVTPILTNPQPIERYKNSLNEGNNNAETEAFSALTKKCTATIDDVRKLMYKMVVNKANTNDW